MGNNQHLAEAILRIEYKIDALMRAIGGGPIPPMHFIGQVCPACNMPIDYTVDLIEQIAIRRCGCKTGKVPATIPLLPVQGTPNVQAASTVGSAEAATADSDAAGPGRAKHGPGRKDR